LNHPPYIITDVFTDIVAAVAAKLNRPVYSYYGYVQELNETLTQYGQSPKLFDKRFPCIWLAQPFTVSPSKIHYVYGIIDELRMFIINDCNADWKAKERMDNNYKPILYPIKEELLNQVVLSKATLLYRPQIQTKITDHYYWGENQKSVLNDKVDTIEVRLQNLKIKENLNC
jgi:hypothetical protein